MRFHGYKERQVNDLDLIFELSAENWPRVKSVLQQFGVNVKKTFDELAQGPRPFKSNDLYPVDVLTAIGSFFSVPQSPCTPLPNSTRPFAIASIFRGISFAEAWADSIETSFGDKGLRVRVLSKAHVVLSKEQSSRAQDADDIKKLLELCRSKVGENR